MKSNNRRNSKLKMESTKETPEARKKRVSSGVRFRAVIFEDKRRKLRDKAADKEDNLV